MKKNFQLGGSVFTNGTRYGLRGTNQANWFETLDQAKEKANQYANQYGMENVKLEILDFTHSPIKAVFEIGTLAEKPLDFSKMTYNHINGWAGNRTYSHYQW